MKYRRIINTRVYVVALWVAKAWACNDRPTVSLLVPGAGSTQSSPDCVHRTDFSRDGADIRSPLTDGVKEKALADVTYLTSETKDTDLGPTV